MKADPSDIRSMTFKDEDRIGIVAFARVELYFVGASSGDVGFVGRDAETIYLGFGVGYLSTAEA